MKALFQTITAVFIAVAFLAAPGTASGSWSPPDYVLTTTPFFLPAPTANNSAGWQIRNFGPVGIGIKIKAPGWTMEITNVEAGSPATGTGILVAGQIIESINGVQLTGVDPRVVLGKLITDAEASDGIISLQIQNLGPVVVTIPVMGSYSPTWPLNCPKTDKIVRNLADLLAAQGQNEWGAVLFLLSTGDEGDLAVVRGWMQNRASFAGNNWSIGYEGIGIAEYYLRTGDSVVLPLMQEAADKLRDTIYAGGWSGRGASFRYNSGGHMNASGVHALTFLLLAKTCGINVDSATLESSLRHFYRYSGRGGVPYGDYTPKTGFNDDNGKTGGLALSMAAASRLTPDGENSIYAQAAQRSATKFFYGTNDYHMGHTGGGIGEIWKSVSMGLMTETLPAQYRAFMDARWWILELSRRHNGGIGIAGGPESNYDKATGESANGWGTFYALNYTLPRKQLHLFGAPLSPWAHSFSLPERPWGTAADDAFSSPYPVPGGPWSQQDITNEVPNLHSGKAVSALLSSGTVSDTDIMTYLHHPEITYRNDAIWAIIRLGKDSMLSYLINADDARLQHMGVMALHEILGTWRTQYKDPSKVTPAMWARIEALIRDPQTSWFVKQWALGLLQHVDTATLKTYTDLLVTLAGHEEYWLRGGARSLSPRLIADPDTYATIFPPVLNAYVDSVPYFEVTGASALKTGLDLASAAIQDDALQLLIPAYTNMPQELVSERGIYVIPDGGEVKRTSFGQVFGFSEAGLLFINTRPKKTSAWKVSGDDADLYTWNGILQANPAVHGMWEYISYTRVQDEAAAIALIQQGLANNTIPLSTVTTYGRGFNIASDGTVAPKGDYPKPMRYSGNMAFGTYIDRAYQFKIVTVYGRKYLMMEDEFLTESSTTVEGDVGSELDPTYQTSYMVFANVNIPDTIPPEIIALSPADNALGVAGSANLVATFSESIVRGTGDITLKNLTDGTQSTIAVTDTNQVSISGRVLTINPTADLMAGKNYAVRIAATAVKDLGNNSFAGIADDTTWDFTTILPLYSSGAKTWDSTTANWGTVTGGPYDAAAWSSGAAAILEGTAGTVTLGEAIALRNLNFTHTTGTYTITNSALNFTSGTITANNPPAGSVGAAIRSNITGSPALNLVPMDGDEQFTLNPVNGGSMSIGTVSGSGGSGSEKLNLQGGAGSNGTIAAVPGAKVIQTAGAWTLNGASYGYGHAISGGTLTLNANLNATHRSVTLSGTGVINYNVANAVSGTAANATAGSDNGFRIQTGATLDQTSGAAINTSTTNPSMTWEGNWTFIGSNGANSDLNLGTGNVFLKTASPQVTVANAAATLTIGGVVQNDVTPGRGLTKAGPGTLELRGTNTYSGATTVVAGKLLINGNQSTASGNVSVSADATLGGTGVIGGATTVAANGRLEFKIGTPAASHDKLDLAAGKSLTFSGASVLTITAAAGAQPGNYTLVTAPGGITGSVPATLNLPDEWTATVGIVGNDLVLNVTSTGVDVAAPTPNPMTFAVLPVALGETSITMTATTATDPGGVEYFFECTAGGGPDSGWQSAPVFTPMGLAHGTTHTYTVRARDAALNETAPSAPASATTDTPDTTPPTISSLSPADNATDVAIGANLVATFSEDIALGTGDITLKNLSDGTQTTIAVTDAAQVLIAGAVLTINPAGNLAGGKTYAIWIAATAIKDLANNTFAGIADDTTWNFATDRTHNVIVLYPGWNLVSIVSTPVDNTLQGVFGEAVTPPAFVLRGQHYLPVNDLLPERGHWVYCPSSTPVEIDLCTLVYPATATRRHGSIHLSPGWNCISIGAVPADHSVKAILAAHIHGSAWTADGNVYKRTSTLLPNRGHMILYQGDTDIDIDVPGAP